MVETYPPRPDFESFNLWRTRTNTGLFGCLSVVAGRQIRHMSDGEGDPAVYEPRGWLFIFGDLHHDKDGSLSWACLSPDWCAWSGRGHGYKALLLLQSLADCSTITYDVSSAIFRTGGLDGAIRCPTRPDAATR